MRIAILTDTYDEINGVANTYHELAKYCSKKRLRLEIFCPSSKDSVEKKGTVKIHRVRQLFKIPVYSDLNFDLKIISPYIEKYFIHNRFDLVQASSPGNMGLQAMTLSYYHRLPLVGVYHTALPEYVEKRALRIGRRLLPKLKKTGVWENITWDFVQWFYGRCDLVLSPSEYTRKVLKNKLKPPVRIFSRGIDLKRFNPKFRKRSKTTRILYVGRISVEKGLDDLVWCFSKLENARLIIVGGGPYRQELEIQPIKNIIFRGFLKGKSLSREYASADIFVFPSKTDTFGNVVLEAMASGLPVIVTDKMAPKELVSHKQNGYVVKSRRDMLKKLRLLVDDSEKRKSMGNVSRKLAEKRTWNKVFEKLFQDYEYVRENYDYSRKFNLFDIFRK